MRHGSALLLMKTTVAAEWVDYNRHMNDAAYALVFSRSGDVLMDRVGLDAKSRESTGRTLYTMQVMLHYFKEAKEGEAISVTGLLLEHDDKRMRVWLEMSNASGDIIAASEQLYLSIQLGVDGARAAPFSFETASALDALARSQAGAPVSPLVGQGVTLKRKQ